MTCKDLPPFDVTLDGTKFCIFSIKIFPASWQYWNIGVSDLAPSISILLTFTLAKFLPIVNVTPVGFGHKPAYSLHNKRQAAKLNALDSVSFVMRIFWQ